MAKMLFVGGAPRQPGCTVLGVFSGRSSDSCSSYLCLRLADIMFHQYGIKLTGRTRGLEPSSDFGARLPGWQVLPSWLGLATLLSTSTSGPHLGGFQTQWAQLPPGERKHFISACHVPLGPVTGVSNKSLAPSQSFLVPRAQSQLPILHYCSLLHKPYQPHSHLHPHLLNTQL